MAFKSILLGHDGQVAVITLNRPKALNALNGEVVRELGEAVDLIAADENVKAVVIMGAGDKAFAAGADITEINGVADAAEGEAIAQRAQETFDKIEKLGKPVIAAVNGFGLGGGCELLLACDIRIAADVAKLGLPETNLGVLPGGGGTQRMARLVGSGMAKMLIFSGEIIDSAEALRIGLVERVVPAEELIPTVMAFAKKLAAKAPLALAESKAAINNAFALPLDEGCALEAAAFGRLAATEDAKEGTSAFMEKRKATFTGK